MKTFLVRAGGYGGGIGDVVYTENGSSGEREYFLYNAIGSTSALTDDFGSVISTTNYGAWGAETGTTGSSENVRKFSTKERSASIGLDYFGFRYYDPGLGRFLTRDPAGYPDGPNNYLYCMNSPVNKLDPQGLASRRWEEDLLQKLWEGLARQRHLELKAKREKEAKSISRIAQRRVEALGGTEDDKRIVAESSQALKTSVAVGTTVAETAMEFHPVVAVSNVVNGRDLNGNKLSVGERAWEAATAIPAVAILDKGIDAAKVIRKAANAGEILTDTQVSGIKKAVDKVDDYVDLTDTKAKRHILGGEIRPDGTYGGGHRFGTGFPGKSEFPEDWSDEKILHTISDIVTDPQIKWKTGNPKTGYLTTTKTVDGIAVKVIYDPKKGRIVSGYPTNTPKNLK